MNSDMQNNELCMRRICLCQKSSFFTEFTYVKYPALHWICPSKVSTVLYLWTNSSFALNQLCTVFSSVRQCFFFIVSSCILYWIWISLGNLTLSLRKRTRQISEIVYIPDLTCFTVGGPLKPGLDPIAAQKASPSGRWSRSRIRTRTRTGTTGPAILTQGPSSTHPTATRGFYNNE